MLEGGLGSLWCHLGRISGVSLGPVSHFTRPLWLFAHSLEPGAPFLRVSVPVMRMLCYPTSSSLFLFTQSQWIRTLIPSVFSSLNPFFGNNPFRGQSLLISVAEALLWERAGTTENPRTGRRSHTFSCVELRWLLLCLPAPSQFSIHLDYYFSSLLLTFQRFIFKGGRWVPSLLTCMIKLKKLSC